MATAVFGSIYIHRCLRRLEFELAFASGNGAAAPVAESASASVRLWLHRIISYVWDRSEVKAHVFQDV